MAIFCLVHSSVQGPEGWALLVEELHRRGHRCITPDLAEISPDSPALVYAQAIADTIKAEIGTDGEKLWLVGHSAGGLFLPWVVDLLPDFDWGGLVYLAAYAPHRGLSLLGSLSEDPDMFDRDWLGKDAMDDDVALQFLFHDCDQQTADWALGTRSLMVARCAMEEVLPGGIGEGVRAEYIVCRDDRTLAPDWMVRAAKTRLGAKPFYVDGGHCPQVSRPAEIAEILTAL